MAGTGSGSRRREEVRGTRYIAATVLPRIVDEQGYKLTAIAAEIGRTRGYVSLVVRGKRTVGEEDARKFARFFRLPLDVLFRPNE